MDAEKEHVAYTHFINWLHGYTNNCDELWAAYKEGYRKGYEAGVDAEHKACYTDDPRR